MIDASVSDTPDDVGSKDLSDDPDEDDPSDDPDANDPSDDPDANGPIGAVILATIVGGFFLVANPFPPSLQFFGWGFVAISGAALFYVFWEFYHVQRAHGLETAIAWLVGSSGQNEGPE